MHHFKKTGRAGLLFLQGLVLIGKPKIFCISFQKCGTKSVGEFFKRNGFKVASHNISFRNKWSLKFFSGQVEDILKSLDFNAHQVFEDDPWWFNDFYKVLFHRFPTAKFVLLIRDSDEWFTSMKMFKGGKTLGNTYRHSKLYRREQEYYDLNPHKDRFYSSDKDSLMTLTEEHRDHYKKVYELRIREIIEFFNEFGKERLFVANLEDKDKWIRLGEYLGLKIDAGVDFHENKNLKN